MKAFTTARLLYRALMEIYKDTKEPHSFSSPSFNSIQWGLIVLITGLGFIVFILVGKIVFLLNLLIDLDPKIPK